MLVSLSVYENFLSQIQDCIRRKKQVVQCTYNKKNIDSIPIISKSTKFLNPYTNKSSGIICFLTKHVMIIHQEIKSPEQKNLLPNLAYCLQGTVDVKIKAIYSQKKRFVEGPIDS